LYNLGVELNLKRVLGVPLSFWFMKKNKVVNLKQNSNSLKMINSKQLFQEIEKYYLESIQKLNLTKISSYLFIGNGIDKSKQTVEKNFKNKKLPKEYMSVVELLLFASSYYKKFFKISFTFYTDLEPLDLQSFKIKNKENTTYWKKWIQLVENKQSKEFNSVNIMNQFKIEYKNIRTTSIHNAVEKIFYEYENSQENQENSSDNFDDLKETIKSRILIIEYFYRLNLCLTYISRLKRFIRTDNSRKENHEHENLIQEIFKYGEESLIELGNLIKKDSEFYETLQLLKLQFYGDKSIYNFSWEYLTFTTEKIQEIIQNAKKELETVKSISKLSTLAKFWFKFYGFFIVQKEIELELKLEDYISAIEKIEEGIEILDQILMSKNLTRINLKAYYFKRDLEFKKLSLEAYFLEKETEGVYEKKFDHWDSYNYDEDFKKTIQRMIEIKKRIMKTDLNSLGD
jgi:hypothetical protein